MNGFRFQALAPVLVIAGLWALLSVPHSSAQTVPPGMRQEIITDPVLNMTAFEVAVPAKWHFAGRLLQGTSCSGVPYPVFRETSPDGLSVLERLPRMDWSWGNGPGAGAHSDCLPLKQEMSAKEFVKYVATMLKAEYVADDPYPSDVTGGASSSFEQAKAANAARYRAAGMIPPEERSEIARAIVRFKNGSFTMKGQISVSIYCSTNFTRGMGGRPALEMHNCQANVRYAHGPEAGYAQMMSLLEKAGASQNNQWTQAWTAESNRQTQQNMAAINARAQQTAAQLQASNQQFAQSQATRQRMHQEFMNSMQRGTDMSMNRTQQNMNARQTATSNVVDYALDQQTVRDPSSGQVSKVSSAYSYTWVDSTGKTSYQTNDANANPNGSLSGNWTRQQVVNGDGTSK